MDDLGTLIIKQMIIKKNQTNDHVELIEDDENEAYLLNKDDDLKEKNENENISVISELKPNRMV